MSKSRLELKVGIFVLGCLIVVGALMVQFSKGTTFLRKTYLIRLHANNVGGLKPRASVLMSGVQVGTVAQTFLAPDSKSVTINLKIYGQFVIYGDALFKIAPIG